MYRPQATGRGVLFTDSYLAKQELLLLHSYIPRLQARLTVVPPTYGIVQKLALNLQEDKPWDWDRLFTEVTSELLTEWEKKEEVEDEAPVA